MTRLAGFFTLLLFTVWVSEATLIAKDEDMRGTGDVEEIQSRRLDGRFSTDLGASWTETRLSEPPGPHRHKHVTPFEYIQEPINERVAHAIGLEEK